MEMEGVPVYGYEHLDGFASSGVRHAIVAAPELSPSEFAEVLERGSDAFPHLILIPDTDSIWKIGSYTRDLMGILGVHVHNNLLSSGSRFAKRTIDLTCATVLALFLVPINCDHLASDCSGVGISGLLLSEKIGLRGPDLSHVEI